jgi:omega-6 fatty acid desaturase (delta-12 desaturase)
MPDGAPSDPVPSEPGVETTPVAPVPAANVPDPGADATPASPKGSPEAGSSATPAGVRSERAARMAEEKRAGAALVRSTKPFAEEDIAVTWRLFGLTMAVYAAFLVAAVFHPWVSVRLGASVFAGLTLVRVFIFYHDYLHGAIWRESTLGRWIMNAYGWWVLAPAPVWQETHDYHHQNNAKMVGASIGSYPTVTTKMWGALTDDQRWWYRFARNPATIVFGYFTIFIGGMCVAAFARAPKQNWQGPAALAAHVATATAVGWAFGPLAAFTGVVLPLFVATGAGSYLFYAQHNFPSCELRGRDTWTYHHAALRASSMFDMPLWLHWFTGNIGYHHVHHLNHKIPFYRLPEAMAAIPELQSPGRTSWWPSDVAACLRLKLWDPDQNRLVGWVDASGRA